MNFGDRLKELRENQGLSQEKLAKKTGISNSHISLIERKQRQPGIDTLISLANFFNVSTDYLLGLDENKIKKEVENIAIKKFEFTEEQVKKIDVWDKQHECKLKDEKGNRRLTTTGGRLKYTFIPTSIGMIQKVRCSCGVELDLTEYNKW